MPKTFLMRMDGVGASVNNIKISNISFDIPNGEVSIVRSDYPDELCALADGGIVPYKGNIYLAGVNITERNANERRVAKMPSSVSGRNIKKLLSGVLADGLENPTVYENRRADLTAKIAKLKSEKNDRDKRADTEKKIKQAQIDYTAVGLKMKRRQSELELNLKAAKSLLADLKKNGVSEHISKMEAKYFSAQYEYAMYMHKKLSSSVSEDRIQRVVNELSLSESSDEATLCFACAYVKAPVLIVLRSDSSDIARLNDLCSKTGISVCIFSDRTYNAEGANVIDIAQSHFSVKAEGGNNA